MNVFKKSLKILSVLTGLILGVIVFCFIASIIFKKSYTAIEFETVTNIFYTNIGMPKPNFLNHVYTQDFFWYMMIRIITISTLIILINIKNKSHRVIKYLGTSLVLSSCFFILCGAFYFNILNIIDSQIVNILTGSEVFRANLVVFGTSFLILGLFLHVTYSTIDVMHDEKHNRNIINSSK